MDGHFFYQEKRNGRNELSRIIWSEVSDSSAFPRHYTQRHAESLTQKKNASTDDQNLNRAHLECHSWVAKSAISGEASKTAVK